MMKIQNNEVQNFMAIRGVTFMSLWKSKVSFVEIWKHFSDLMEIFVGTYDFMEVESFTCGLNTKYFQIWNPHLG